MVMPPVPEEVHRKIRRVQGPILVLGGSGFVGANLMHCLAACREDVTPAGRGATIGWRCLPSRNCRAWPD